MKHKTRPKAANPKPPLLLRLIDPQLITLTGKHDPAINNKIKKIISRSS